MPELPAQIYVLLEEGDKNDETWLNAQKKAEDLAPAAGATARVGVYGLLRVVDVSTKITVE